MPAHPRGRAEGPGELCVEKRPKRVYDATKTEEPVTVLVIRCAACKQKLWKYDKVGQGQVLRCHKHRIIRSYRLKQTGDRVQCVCGKDIGIDKGPYIKMIAKAFTHTGTKRNS